MFKSYGLDDRIEIKLENIASDLPYNDDTFDYIYARLVLHYLDKQQLTKALSELYRVLRPNGIFFVVVRSTNNIDASERASDYDEQTGLTTYTTRPGSKLSDVRKRFFHTPETISHYLEAAGFTVTQNIQYDERLYHDYGRTLLSQNVDNLVEVIAKK